MLGFRIYNRTLTVLQLKRIYRGGYSGNANFVSQSLIEIDELEEERRKNPVLYKRGDGSLASSGALNQPSKALIVSEQEVETF